MNRSPLLLAPIALMTAGCPAVSGSLDIAAPAAPVGPTVPTDDGDDETPPTSRAAALCTTEGDEPADTPALAFGAGSAFFMVRADGTQELLHDFIDEVDESANIHAILTAGGFSAALGRSDLHGQFFGTFDEDGELIAEGFRNNTNLPYIHEMYLSEDGWLTAYTGTWSGFVVSPEGEYTTLRGLVPTAAPFAAGRVSVIRSERFDHERAWWTPENGVEPLAFEAREFLLHRVGDHLVYTADVGDGDIRIVLEDGETVETIDVPDDAPRLTAIESDRWLLMGGRVAERSSFRVVRVDARSRTVEDVEAVLPEGFWVMRHGELDIEPGGALLLPIRTEGAAGLFRSEDGSDWELVGEAVYDAMSLVSGNRAGTVLSRSVENIGSPFVDEEYGDIDGDWAPVVGDHFQFSRPSDGWTWLLPAVPNGHLWDWSRASDARPRNYVSMDGTCVAYWEPVTPENVRLGLLHIEAGPVERPNELGPEAEGVQPGPIAFYNL